MSRRLRRSWCQREQLAGLPDGAGIAALVRLARDPAVSALGGGDDALRPLAQVALQYPEAGRALIDLARGNQVSDTAWSTVAATLGGAYVQYGHQIFGSTAPSVDWSAPGIDRRMAFIDQLLVVTSSDAGRQALQHARATLASRLPR